MPPQPLSSPSRIQRLTVQGTQSEQWPRNSMNHDPGSKWIQEVLRTVMYFFHSWILIMFWSCGLLWQFPMKRDTAVSSGREAAGNAISSVQQGGQAIKQKLDTWALYPFSMHWCTILFAHKITVHRFTESVPLNWSSLGLGHIWHAHRGNSARFGSNKDTSKFHESDDIKIFPRRRGFDLNHMGPESNCSFYRSSSPNGCGLASRPKWSDFSNATRPWQSWI